MGMFYSLQLKRKKRLERDREKMVTQQVQAEQQKSKKSINLFITFLINQII